MEKIKWLRVRRAIFGEFVARLRQIYSRCSSDSPKKVGQGGRDSGGVGAGTILRRKCAYVWEKLAFARDRRWITVHWAG